MAFMVTYHSLAKNNIRNLYGGLPGEIKLRVSTSSNAMTSSQRIQEQYRKTVPYEKFLNERYLEYDHEHGTRIPRAPAFRQISASEVDKIVDRLSQPTVSKRRRASDICEREFKRSFIEGCRKCRAVSARSTVSRQKVDEITTRVSLPTVQTNVRNSLRSVREYSAKDLRGSCQKCAPSDRFARDFGMYNI